jgi:pyruvoyl-dependent arginine decarboxylase (PvlArgDC)
MADFVEDMTGYIAEWHGVTPPNPVALRMVADLQKVIADVAALRGTLRFEDEPSSFEAALREAAQA